MLKGVEKLQPGHYLSVNGTLVNTTAYYELEINSGGYGQYSYKDAQARLIGLMNESVKERMISDVPLGAFLSGGIDSSIIVALASAHTRNLKTFSVGYRDNPLFDETSYAELVARKYNTDHTVFSLTNSDFLEHIFEILDYLDEPFADSSAIPTYILCKKTREHVTVALSGDGGDEVFSGYNKHRAEWQIRQKSLINSLIVSGAPLWKAIPKSHGNKLTNLFRQMDKFAAGAKLSIRERYWRWATVSGPETVNLLLSEHFSQQLEGERIREDKNFYLQTLKTDDFNEVLEVDMRLVLPGDMLVKVDQMSMANSLEVRCPFLDHKVVDFAFGLPASFKIDDKYKKKIVQDAFRSMLPDELYNRPKHGFEIPMLDWLRNELWPLIDDLLGKNFIREQKIFDVDGIEQLKKKLRSHDPGNSHALVWALVVFQYWWKKYYS
jgi:asparagine synthase (glutamine-hydrolysing)